MQEVEKGINLTTKQQIQEKLEKAYALYPQEHDRIKNVAQKIFEMDRWITQKAFESAIQKVIDAKTPSDAKRQIDSLEHIVVTSTSFTFLNKVDKILKRYLDIPIKILLIISVFFYC